MRIAAILLVLVFPFATKANESMQRTAETVLNKLYKANGNFIYLKPQLKITQDEKNAALFLRRSNVIELSKKAFEVCRGFGRDSTDALAFILGHEMSHAYQSLKSHETSFLAYDKYHDEGTEVEENADLRGVFISYLAGYKTVEIVPQVIDGIYTAFNLKGKKLKGYPGFKQRQATANRVQKLTEELIQIFEAGNHLMAIGEYELAGACYEHVEQFYNGKELYNNIGVCYALLSLDFSDNFYDPFLYPIEISWNTRMNKPNSDRSNQNLTAAENALRIEYLTKAETSFLMASKMDAHYIAPEINLMCAMVMRGAAAEAVEYYMQNQLLKKSKLIADDDTAKEKIRLAFSIALYASGKEEQARRIWTDLTTMNHGLIAQQADNNLTISVGGETPMSIIQENTPCKAELSAQNKMIDGVKLHRFSQLSFQSLAKTNALDLAISNKSNSIVYTFKKSGKVAFVLQRVLQSISIDLSSFLENGGNGLLTNQGYITVCKDERLSFVVSDQNRVLEWGKYYQP